MKMWASKQFKTTSLFVSPQQYKQLLKHCGCFLLQENEKNRYQKLFHFRIMYQSSNQLKIVFSGNSAAKSWKNPDWIHQNTILAT